MTSISSHRMIDCETFCRLLKVTFEVRLLVLMLVRYCRMSGSAIKKFEIHLEHDIDEQYQYEPGEMLRGEVQLTTTEEIRVCSVEVQIRGEASVSWDSNEASSGGQQFSARETYIDTSVELPLTADAGGPSTGHRRPSAGAGSGKTDAVTFGRGEHSFPLEIALPSTLPSSFIGKYGSITYVLKATVREDKVLYNICPLQSVW